MLTDVLISLELGALPFLVIAILSASTSPVTVVSVGGELILGGSALIIPFWWWSRRLTLTEAGVSYAPLFYSTKFIAYGDVQVIQIEGKRQQELGSAVMVYYLSICGSQGRSIRITIYYYQTADLRDMIATIQAHSRSVRLQGLTRSLLNGAESFAKRRVNRAV